MNIIFDFKGKKYGVVSLGEVMMRFSPPTNEMIVQGDVFEKQIGGSELNVVAGIESLGRRSAIITKIPDNELGRFVKRQVRSHGVSDDYLIYDSSIDKRLGIYYYEYGAHPRKPRVIYDRKHSSFTTLQFHEIPEEVFEETEIFHLSGVTLGLSQEIRDISVDLIKAFKEKGALISFDVNFRATLWTEEEARESIEKILPYIDILFASEETFRKMFKKEGSLREIQRNFAEEFDIQVIATTQRTVVSPKKHDFGSLVYHKERDCFFAEEPYSKIDVVDRIGSGDAYLSGALFGILKHNNLEKAMEYGNAMSVLKNTILGDLCVVDLQMVDNVIKEHKNKGSFSEMTR